MEDAYLLIVSDSYKVQIDGTVEYVSTNCEIDDAGTNNHNRHNNTSLSILSESCLNKGTR